MRHRRRKRRHAQVPGAGAWLAGLARALGAALASALLPSARRYLRLRAM
jgi:hypothetical protein